jgi:cytoskeleton-associated protein 5
LFSREFGSKVLPIKPFIKAVIPLLDDRDKSVRDEAKLLLIEVYKWIGKQTLMPLIQNVKPIQVNFTNVAHASMNYRTFVFLHLIC